MLAALKNTMVEFQEIESNDNLYKEFESLLKPLKNEELKGI